MITISEVTSLCLERYKAATVRLVDKGVFQMDQESGRYVVSIQAQAFRKKTRYHWMICWENNPDEMVSWGHAPTQELAETEARNEVKDLTSGLTQGGRVASTSYSAIHHC